MNPMDRFWSILKKLQKQCSAALDTSRLEDSILINEIKFRRLSRLGLVKTDFPLGEGIMLKKISPDEEKYCRSNGISFLTTEGKLSLIGKDYKLNLELMPRRKSALTSKKLDARKDGIPSPTALISPNGLEILDVLFRLPPEDLSEFKSALRFAHEFHLSQPKLSLMMKKLNVKSLGDLREKIKSLPNSWWEGALRYSLTKKGLFPFFEGEKIVRSLRIELSRNQIWEMINVWLGSRSDLLPGPVEIVKKIGLIRDDDIYLWGTPSAIQEVKTAFKLIPDRSVQETNWHVAISPVALEKGAILSPLANSRRVFFLPEVKANLFRSVWDLGFGGERLQEIQLTALRKILDAF